MNKNPTVVIIGPAYPLRGGLSSFNERLARQWMSEGSQVDLYTFSLQYPSFLFPGSTQYSTELVPKDLSIFEVINSINPFNWIKIGWHLKNKKNDLVIVRYWLPFMGPCLGTILRLIKWNRHTRIICIADNIIPHEKRFGDRVFTRYFIKPVDGFITMSQQVLQDLKLFTQKPALQVAHPLYDNFGEALNAEHAKQHLAITIDKKVVLFFGFIRKYKGLDLLLEAIYLLKQKNYFQQHPILFVIAGEFYEDPAPYHAQLAKYGIEDWVMMKNEFIPDQDVKYYLSAADCVIQPYKSATQSGVTPLAYHFEKPMIVTKVGGLPLMVPESIGIVTNPDADSIARSIETYFSMDASVFISNIKEEKKKYGWDRITKAIMNLVPNSNQ